MTEESGPRPKKKKRKAATKRKRRKRRAPRDGAQPEAKATEAPMPPSLVLAAALMAVSGAGFVWLAMSDRDHQVLAVLTLLDVVFAVTILRTRSYVAWRIVNAWLVLGVGTFIGSVALLGDRAWATSFGPTWWDNVVADENTRLTFVLGLRLVAFVVAMLVLRSAKVRARFPSPLELAAMDDDAPAVDR